ncbi:helicase C-terminal domain-containing protein [Paraphysoderma sedebokerense]|nr:helicase C-terminal domain-containing protein [Paraphysoderma sedebokerense]
MSVAPVSRNINGVTVNFPFNPYKCQIDFMEKVILSLQGKENALLESPTGTGKTLCLLCATLAWREAYMARRQLEKNCGGLEEGDNEYRESLTKELNSAVTTNPDSESWLEEPPKIFYASRTHSQLSQAIKELRNTGYKVRTCILGSREQMCLDPDVSKATTNTARTNLCRQKTAKRQCQYHLGVDKAKNDPMFSVETSVADIEDLIKYGEEMKACPYFLSREHLNQADIVFLPYNYLVDSKSRENQNIDVKNSIIIFDEAHNLESTCGDATSFELSSTDIALCINEADECIRIAGDMTYQGKFDADSYALVKALLVKFERHLDSIEIPASSNDIVKPGKFIYELFENISVQFSNVYALLQILEEGVSLIVAESHAKKNASKCALNNFASALKILFRQEYTEVGFDIDELTKYYKVHIQKEKPRTSRPSSNVWTVTHSAKIDGRTLSYWCFSPGVAMKELVKKDVRSVILASGTLKPLESFAAELQLPFPHTLENPHVIQPHQAMVGILRKGPRGHTLNSSFKTRNRVEYKEDLGNVIVNFSRIVPDGLLVFFPSYGVMEDSIRFWQQPPVEGGRSIYERISQFKEIIVEPKNKLEFATAMDDFYTRINSPSHPNGVAFFAVCRGKVSEGVDFADNRGRAVIITGIPFPNATDPKVTLKKKFLDEMHAQNSRKKSNIQSISGQDWYTQQAARAVNQAIGRVIRHRKDYGAILLCDERFSFSNSKSQLPVWVQPFIKEFGSFGEAQRQLTNFFRQMSNVAMKESSGPIQNNRPVSSQLSSMSANSSPKSLPSSSAVARHLPAASDRSAKLAYMLQHTKTIGHAALLSDALLKQYGGPGGGAKRQISYDIDDKTDVVLAKRKRGATSLMDTLKQYHTVNADDPTRPSLHKTTYDTLVGSKTLTLTKQKPSATSKTTTSQSKLQSFTRSNSIPSITTSSSTNPSSSSTTTSNYLQQVKSSLPASSYREFQILLKKYKSKETDKSFTIDVFLDSIINVFAAVKEIDLLVGFKPYVPSKYHTLFLEKVNEYVALHPEVMMKDDKIADEPDNTTISNENHIKSQPKSDKPTCLICQNPVRHPFKLKKCNHHGCHACWIDYLKKNKVCPSTQCNEVARGSALEKMYFY